MSSLGTAHVALRGVEKLFARSERPGDAVHALGPINLELQQGEFFAVVGPSGCGKSTLLELIAGLSTASRGEVAFEGRPIAGEIPDGVGVVFQEDASFPWLSVSDNIAFGLRCMKLGKDERDARIARALEMMGLGTFASSFPAQLSGGMRQRVCIARTLVTEPRLILLDEPFGALDQQTRLLMGDEVLTLWRKTGATVFLITHALDEAAMLADRIGVMSARPGRLIDVVETLWPKERDSRIVEEERFGAITARLWHSLRAELMKAIGRAEGGPVKPATVCRIAILAALVAGLEILCLTKVIDHITMQPPHRMILDLVRLLVSGSLDRAIGKTLGNVAAAFAIAMGLGLAAGVALHRWKRLRGILDPLLATYYAVPVFAFYPLLIILLGLGDLPQIFIGAMLGIVAVIVNTLNGLDRVPAVLLKAARISRLGKIETALRVTLPCAAPYLLAGAKLAVAYSFIGIIGAEFIMSNSGMGYEISFAYTNFDNATMYPLILLILAISITVNTLLARWEKTLMARRGLG